jgi:hypothetical protein
MAEGAIAPRQRRLLMLGWLVPPLVWLGQMQLAYALTLSTCQNRKIWPLLAVHAAGALVTILVGASALHAWRGLGATWPGKADDGSTRESFAAIVGVLISAQVLLILIAQVLAVIVIGPCD